MLNKFKKRKLDKDGNYVFEEKPEKKGRPNQEWMDKHGLTHLSSPIQFFEAMYPHSLTDKWTKYTNNKAILENAGEEGKPYPDWTHFTCKETRQHISLHIFHGLSPSPRIEMKFKSQAQDEVNGNDFINRAFGPNATRRHKMWKSFLCVQNPALRPPTTRKGTELEGKRVPYAYTCSEYCSLELWDGNKCG